MAGFVELHEHMADWHRGEAAPAADARAEGRGVVVAVPCSISSTWAAWSTGQSIVAMTL